MLYLESRNYLIAGDRRIETDLGRALRILRPEPEAMIHT